MQKYDLALDKYWVTQISYFRIGTKVTLNMGIIYVKLLLCCVISGGHRDKKITMREYNDR